MFACSLPSRSLRGCHERLKLRLESWTLVHLFDSCAFVSALLMVSLEAPATQSNRILWLLGVCVARRRCLFSWSSSGSAPQCLLACGLRATAGPVPSRMHHQLFRMSRSSSKQHGYSRPTFSWPRSPPRPLVACLLSCKAKPCAGPGTPGSRRPKVDLKCRLSSRLRAAGPLGRLLRENHTATASCKFIPLLFCTHEEH